jgi:adenine-specific DNA-methyltransferase
MAESADFGLMVWDGKSAGTILNVLRLARLGKKAVLVNVADNSSTNFKTMADWDIFFVKHARTLKNLLWERATLDERELLVPTEPDLLDGRYVRSPMAATALEDVIAPRG